jgi:Domain of Unknown Function (DUF1259)
MGKEVNPVLKAMRNNGIEVTALHSHMIDHSPRLRAALDLANVKHGS